ncbi:EAL domain-containing protein [Pseudomonas entomophila]|uniref:bifunctional diguanylate cyclase/phosphodiesterase n=1 Tax=Pseudomonas entomophila TaxID=312306 RepID=UPI0015E287A7|nr:EAL domain-containing protein [Pseudomonas entomophila]MBA1191020.1 EAL domain-containing protein [Pseudomonas entomophila]
MDRNRDKGLSTRNQVIRRLMLAFSGLLVVMLLVMLTSLYRLAGSLDEREAHVSRFHIESTLAQLEKAERSYITGHALWQAAYDHLSRTVNTQWAFDEDNIGATLYSEDGYEGVYVLDDAGTRYAVVDGQLSGDGLSQRSTQEATILAAAREAALEQEATTGYLLYEGRPALFTAAVIRPPTPADALPSPNTVLAFIRVLDDDLLAMLGRSAGLEGVSLATRAPHGPAADSLPLPGSGQWLTWQVAQPGKALLHAVGIPLILATLLIALIVAVLGRYALRVSASIDRGQQRLAASKAALQTSEARFKAIAESASDWIWETDPSLRLIYLSSRFTELTGLETSHWLGRPITDLLDCCTGELDAWLRELGSSGEPGVLRCGYRDRSGAQRICRISARAILAADQCQGFRGTTTDITDQVAAHAQIQHLSLHDALTNLPNRNKLYRHLEHLAHNEPPELAVVMLDLEQFKLINEGIGHPAGDAVLLEVTERLVQATRDGDLIARLDGDEFVIVLVKPGQRPELDRFCTRIIDSVRQPIQFEGRTVQVGVSVGVALSSEQGGTPLELLRYADIALDTAKREGHNTWRYFSSAMSTALLDKRLLQQELRDAILHGQLRLHYQPRFRVDGVTIAAAEALVRWQHPVRGLQAPDAFIPLAEESDLIVLLGNWVMHEACERARAWPLEITVSVNLSPAQFSRSDVVRDVHDVLMATGLPARRLELEITENVMLNDVEGALHTMQALKELGVRLNMDDFGTGYSSLGYLRTYPFDGIKIDKRFTQALGKSDSDRCVVQAIINLGNAMGMTVTAEGVETPEQLALLIEDQCHEVQGYLLSRPIENEALVRLMSQ